MDLVISVSCKSLRSSTKTKAVEQDHLEAKSRLYSAICSAKDGTIKVADLNDNIKETTVFNRTAYAE